MKWIVEGANPQTGRELHREIEATTAEEAEQLARNKGMLVSAVKPLPVPALDYNTLPKFNVNSTKPAGGPQFICPNPNCGFKGPSLRQKRGSETIAFLLILMAIIPGIFYIALCMGHRDSCPNCGIEVKLP